MRKLLAVALVTACGISGPPPSVPLEPPPPELAELTKILTPGGGPTIDAAQVKQLEATLGSPVLTPWDSQRVGLVELQRRGSEMHLVGVATSSEDVAQFLRRLAVSTRFTEVTIMVDERQPDNTESFAVKLTSRTARQADKP